MPADNKPCDVPAGPEDHIGTVVYWKCTCPAGGHWYGRYPRDLEDLKHMIQMLVDTAESMAVLVQGLEAGKAAATAVEPGKKGD